MSLRNKLLAASTFHTKVIELTINGELTKVLLKSPTLGQKTAMFGDVDLQGGAKTMKANRISRMMVRSVIACALDPETQKPIFSEDDEDVLIELPAGSWVETLSNEIANLSEESESAAKK